MDAVLGHLPAHVSYCRFNIDEFPIHTRLDLTPTRATARIVAHTSAGAFDLTHVSAVWFRRLGAATIDPAISTAAHRSFALGEAEAAIAGLAYLLEDAAWVSPFDATRKASAKAYQLRVAVECGLTVPSTLITNDPASARAFLPAHPQTLYKTLHSPSITYSDRRALIFSHVVQPEDLPLFDRIRYTPCQFQEYVPKAYELRITWTGEAFHSIQIDSQATADGRVDWRAAGMTQLRYAHAPLPAEVEHGLRRLVQRLDLHYGAIDMIVTPEGRYVFLEINPHGAWLWLEHEVGLPIAASIANYLTSRVASRART